MGSKTVDSAKASYRDGKDKVCEMVNGKMDCLVKKIRNKTAAAIDKGKTKATEIKNKVD